MSKHDEINDGERLVMSEKAREIRRWTIYHGDTDKPTLDGPAIAYAENVHVIEFSAYQALQTKHDEFESDVADLYFANNEAVKEIDRLKVKLAEAESEQFLTNDKLYKTRDLLESAQARIAELDSYINLWKDKLQTSNQKIQALEAEIETQSGVIKNLQAKALSLHDAAIERDALKSEVERLKESKAELEKMYEAAATAGTTFFNRDESAQAEVEYMKANLKLANEKCEQYFNMGLKLESERGQLKAEIERLKSFDTNKELSSLIELAQVITERDRLAKQNEIYRTALSDIRYEETKCGFHVQELFANVQKIASEALKAGESK